MDFEKAASKCKEKGNGHFAKGEYLQAINDYQQGFTHTNDSDPFFKTNLALCYIKLKNYDKAVEECETAIRLNPKFVKAYFLMGQCHLNNMKFDDAERAYVKAEVLAKELHNTSYSMLISIYKGIDSARARKWEIDEQHRQSMVVELKNYVNTLMNHRDKSPFQSEKEREEFQLKKFQLESFFDHSIHQEKQKDVPETLCCKITYTIMRDPVITPSGITYERSAILKHLKENGQFDPVTRMPCRVDQLYPNLVVKEMSEEWIRKYPYTITEDHYYAVD